MNHEAQSSAGERNLSVKLDESQSVRLKVKSSGHFVRKSVRPEIPMRMCNSISYGVMADQSEGGLTM